MVACGLRGVLLCFDQRSFQLDFQIIANQESSSFKRRVPIKTEIAALDPGGCRGADPGISPQGSFVSADGTSTFSTTSLVTAWIVRLPSNGSSSPCSEIELLLKLMVGALFDRSQGTTVPRQERAPQGH